MTFMSISVGFSAVYMDMSLVDMLCEKYGRVASLGAASFFEVWRNYDFEKAKTTIPGRTVYFYLDMLMSVGLVQKVGHGLYRITPDYDKPIKV